MPLLAEKNLNCPLFVNSMIPSLSAAKMSYYVIKPHTFANQHTFLFLKKKDVPLEARRIVKHIQCIVLRKVHRFSSLIEFCERSCDDAPYRMRRVSWVDVLQQVGIKDDWTSDDSESETSED
jgi:hypothetical protein